MRYGIERYEKDVPEEKRGYRKKVTTQRISFV